MRRTGSVLLSITAAVLALPVPATAAAAAAVACVPSTLPALPGTTDGGQATAIVEPGTYLGLMSEPYQGVIWRNGSVAPLSIIPEEVNPSGLAVGKAWNGQASAARMQLGGTRQVWATTNSYLDDVNAAGDSVGWRATGYPPNFRYEALWWKRGEASPRVLSSATSNTAGAIDDLGNMVGTGTTTQGERRWLIWGPDGTIKRQYGPFASGQTMIAPEDVDNGTAVAYRRTAAGAQDIVLINVATGAITPVPGTSGYEPLFINDGWVVGMNIDADQRFVAWHNGVRYNLPSAPGTWARIVSDLEVYGSTAVLVGFGWPDEGPGWYQTPTVWTCGA